MEDGVEKTPILEQKRCRFWELDFVRGICVILMVFDHMMFLIMDAMPEIGEMLGTSIWDSASEFLATNYWMSDLRIYVRFPVLFLFFLICGISCTLSKSNFKRGVICLLAGCLITFATTLVDKIVDLGVAIYFGVLHMLAFAMLLYALFDLIGSLIARIGKTENAKRVTKIIGDYLAPTVGLILFIVFFACFYGGLDGDTFGTNVTIEDMSLSVFASLFINVEPFNNNILYTIGGADYWPLLPWAAIVLIGGFIGRAVYNNDRAKYFLAPLDGKWNKPICFVGRHALLIYVLHQVAIVVLFSLITLIFAI